MRRQKQLKTVLLDYILRETTNLCIEIMSSKRQLNGKTLSRGTNSRSPFDVNMMLNLSVNKGFVLESRLKIYGIL